MDKPKHFGKYLESFIMNTGLSGAEFAKRIKVNRSRITELKKREDFPRLKTIWKIQQQFPDFLENVGKDTRKDAEPSDFELMSVPLVSQTAQAGYMTGFMDDNYVNELPHVYVTKEYEKGNYLVFEIRGDSMDYEGNNAIKQHDKVLAKELPRMYWRDRLYYERYIFIMVTTDGVICKQITNHDTTKGIITCHSFNPIYQDFEVNLDDVYQLFYVKKIVERSVSL